MGEIGFLDGGHTLDEEGVGVCEVKACQFGQEWWQGRDVGNFAFFVAV